MSYSITLTLCCCWILCAAAIEARDSTTDDGSQGINSVAVDFQSQVDRTNVSSDDHPNVTWEWMPRGRERNEVLPSGSGFHSFQDDSDDIESGDSELDEQNETQKEVKDEIWIINVTVYSTPSPKTLDGKRNKTEEKAYLLYERHLRKTNWCFKDTHETTKPTYKFKKTEMCCRRHRECQARRHVKRGIFDCSCDIYFHICLMKAHTKMAKSVEKMYFNRNIVCYKKQREVCKNNSCANATYMWKKIPRHLK